MSNGKDVLWIRSDAFNNKVSLYFRTMNLHISKHAFDKFPTTEEHIYQAVVDPDHARRSLDPVVGHETCIFEKHFPAEGQRFFAMVQYESVTTPNGYEKGSLQGRVSTAYLPGRSENSKSVGQIFWSKQPMAQNLVLKENTKLVDKEGA